MNIKEISDTNDKSKIAEKILRSLPLWFGIESAIVQYIEDVKTMKFWAALMKENAIGFIAIHKHFEKSAEIHVMGVQENYHRQGIGQNLVESAERYLQEEDIRFFQVKTLSPSHSDKGYAKTREFYLHIGFTPVEEFKTLWGEANPALMMMKYIR